jgi:sulfite exporter TauE/SafE
MVSINEGIGLGLALLMGLVTSAHCLGMCGGFVVAYTTAGERRRRNTLGLHAWYAVGKLVSYGVIGAAFGLLGQSIAISDEIRVGTAIAAGVLLIAYGLASLGVLPFRHLMGARVPTRVLRYFTNLRGRYRHPLLFGLSSGLLLMCGPLQAMYVAAAGTGSVARGAVLLLAFALGTLPLLTGFGLAAGLLSFRFTRRALQVSAVVVIILGAMMINRGVAISHGEATCCNRPQPPAPVVPE